MEHWINCDAQIYFATHFGKWQISSNNILSVSDKLYNNKVNTIFKNTKWKFLEKIAMI